MKTPLTVVSLGPGDPRYLTRQAEAALREASCLILRTGRHRAAEWLAGEGVAFETLDDFYDRYDFSTRCTPPWRRRSGHGTRNAG